MKATPETPAAAAARVEAYVTEVVLRDDPRGPKLPPNVKSLIAGHCWSLFNSLQMHGLVT